MTATTAFLQMPTTMGIMLVSQEFFKEATFVHLHFMHAVAFSATFKVFIP